MSQRNRARQFLKYIVTGMATGAVFAVVLMAYQWLDRASVRPVNEFVLTGSYNRLEKSDINSMVAPLIEDGELNVPLASLRDTLEANAWIDQAVVNWRWPGRLNITVVEQIPIARWGKKGFVNSRGQIIELPNQAAIAELPLLSGLPGQEKAVMQNYQQLNQLLRMSNLRLTELTCDELMNWSLMLENGTRIIIGRDQVMEKMQRFLVVFEQSLDGRFNQVAQVDLRYDNGVAVAWHDQNHEIKAGEGMQLARLGERRGG